MIDFNGNKADGNGVLVKVNPKTDNTASDALVFEIHVSFDVASEEDADTVALTVPGAGLMYQLSQDPDVPDKFRTARKSGQTVSFTIANEDGKVLVDAKAEVYECLFIAGKKCTLVAKLRTYALDGAAIAETLNHLGKTVYLAVERAQMGFEFDAAAGMPEVGQVVRGGSALGDVYAGQVVSVDEESGEVTVDDFGESSTHPADSVESMLYIAKRGEDDAPDLEAVLKVYQTRCNERGLTPSWEYLLGAIMHLHGLGDLDSDSHGRWAVTLDVASEAMNKADELPAEPETA